ncbi:hypothetical protein ANTRET_LOCUS3055 [Anthophora retusa]
MATSAMWIRNNMLLPCDQYERQLTEAELKVQRSLQKLSIPDWYLNKRTNPPKILNFTSIESRPPSWKNVTRHSCTLNSISSPSDTLSPVDQKPKGKSSSNLEIIVNKPQKTPEIRHKRSPSKSSSPKKEAFDTTIPYIKLSTNISKTFPKVSPSRKIQNINLVFPPGSKFDLNDEKTTENLKYTDKRIDDNFSKSNATPKKKLDDNFSKSTATPKKRNDSFQSSDVETTPLRTPNVKAVFKLRATSTPKFSPANIFSSTIIEESPKLKKIPSRNILERSSFFENSSKSNLSNSFAEKSETTPKQRKISQNLLEKTFIFENSFRMDKSGHSCDGTPAKIDKTNWLLERNIRSIDPIIFEKDDTALSSPKSTSMVRDIVKRLEVSNISESTPKKSRINVQDVRKRNVEPKNSSTIVQEKKCKFESISPFLLQVKQVESPYTRFTNSKRKSTDLENVVKSKQPPKEKSVIQGLIGTLTEKLSRSSLSHQNESTKINHNFVRKLVNALEKGDLSEAEDLMSTRRNSMNEEDSASEYEAKSCTTSASPKDTDSSSDSDHRSSNLRNSMDNTFTDDTLEMKQVLNAGQETFEDDDSVYWIPVSRCKLPRTSSLLSMMSRLSSNGLSPCISPISSETEVDNSQKVAWGATFHRRAGISRKLFRIDETTIIDSGYSDKSERSGVSSASSMVDGTWSEDTQNDSASEILSAKMKRSSRKKTIIGETFCVRS